MKTILVINENDFRHKFPARCSPLQKKFVSLDMKLDYSFKKAFSDREQLRAFLNDMLRGERVVKKVEPRNPEWLPSSPRNRKVLVDVYCTDEDGTHFIVEMQYAEQKYFKDRALFYDCMCIAQQGEQGEAWKFDILPVISIYLLNFVLHKDKPMDKYRTDVGITDLDSGEIYNPKMRDIFIELPKFNKSAMECVDDSELWIYLIKNMEYMDVNAIYFPFTKDSKFTKLLQAGRLANYTPEELDQYRYALKIYRDSKNIYDFAVEKGEKKGFEDGKKEGFQIGVGQGIQEEKRRVAKQMKQQGLPIQTIAICSGLTEDEIEQL